VASWDVLRLRRRSGWEASDSGILLWRRNAGALLLFFALPYTLIVSALCLAPQNILLWTIPGLWWLRPFFDRVILHVISVRFFDHGAPLSRLVRGLGSSLREGLAGDLLWRRFSPWRGGRMPVRVLEKLKGRAARKRIALLESGGLGFSLMVTALGIAINYALLAGEVLFTLNVLNMLNLDSWSGLFQEHIRLFTILSVLANGVNFLVVESLYICMSFGIYINSRLETEGWDLQLDFKRFAEKRAPSGGTGKADTPLSGIARVLVLGLLLLGSWHPLYGKDAGPPALPDAPAAENSTAPLTGEDAALEKLGEALASPDFGSERDSWRIQFKEPEKEAKKEVIGVPGQFSRLRQIFGFILRALVFAVIAAVLAAGLYQYLKTGSFLKRKKEWKSFALAEAEKRKSSALLLEEAKEFQRRGLVREAWARCFAAILAAFSERDRVVFPHDATEYGCLRLLKARNTPEAEAFNAFLSAWIDLAYGGRPPALGCFEEALALCALIQGPANG
jgi:hypothetical protein